MDNNKEALALVQGESHFYYNYANALSNKISVDNPHDHTFQSIEELVSLKTSTGEPLDSPHKRAKSFRRNCPLIWPIR